MYRKLLADLISGFAGVALLAAGIYFVVVHVYLALFYVAVDFVRGW